jgi:hypothetical protein
VDPAQSEAQAGYMLNKENRLLLKYSSRDSIDLLGRGRGGVQDARLAIANYEENTPLYGVIFYRRRKVLIKYVPENTSRVYLGMHEMMGLSNDIH